MATITHRVTTASTANANSYASGAFTPAAGDLLVAFVVTSGTDNSGQMTDSQSLGWDLVAATLKNTSADQVLMFVSRATAAASSMTVTYNCPEDAATGAIVAVFSVSGMTRLGSAAVRQYTVVPNAAAGTPAPAFAASALTGNPTLGVIGNSTSPAGLTPPTGWTEPTGAITVGTNGDTGYSTPTTGGEFVYRDSGFTGTTITWGSASASAYGAIIAELDASAAPTDLITVVGTATTNTSATARTSTVLTSPAGTQANDYILVFIGKSTGTMADSSPPDGTWTKIDSQVNGTTAWGELWYKKLAGAAAATYTFTHGSTVSSGIIWAIRGADTTTLLDRTVQAGDLIADSTTPYDLPTISTTTNGAVVVAVYSSEWTASGNIACVPAGYTTIALVNADTNTTRLGVHRRTVPTAGSTGAASYQVISTSKVAVVGQFALKPASAAVYADMVGVGTVSVTGVAVAKVVVPMAAVGSVAVIGTGVARAVVPMAAVGSVSVVGTGAAQVVVPLAGTGSIDLTGVLEVHPVARVSTATAEAAIMPTATVATVSQDAVEVAASPTSTLALLSQDTIEVLISNATSGYADMTATGTVALAGSASMQTVVPLVGAGTVDVAGTGTASVLVPLSASGVVSVVGTAAMLPKRALLGTGSIAVSGTATAQTVVPLAASGTVSVVGTANMQPKRRLVGAGSVAVVGMGNLTIVGIPYADMAGLGTISINGTGAMQVVVPLSATGTVGVAGAGAMQGVASLAGVGTIDLVGLGALDVLVPLSGVGVVEVVGTGVLASIPPPGNEPAPPMRTYHAPGFVRSTRMSSSRSARFGPNDRVLNVSGPSRTAE